METRKDFRRAIHNSGQSWGAGYGQMFGPLMKKLYDTDIKIKAEVHEHLNKTGIPDSLIEKYFDKYITEGSYMINCGTGMRELEPDKRTEFIKEVDQLMLDILKRYAGLEKRLEPE